MITCRICRANKPFVEFTRGSRQCKLCVNKKVKDYTDLQRLTALAMYSNGEPKCACCGVTEIDFLTLDHKENIGGYRSDGRRRLSGIHLVRWALAQFRPGLQVLCWNCNMAKWFCGICPHELQRQNEATIEAIVRSSK